MKHDFWHNKWTKNEIGFHLAEANPLFVKHFPVLQLVANSRVFLPLCGKTLDIHWLLAQGYQVVGAELSSIAVEALFSELSLTPTVNHVGNLVQYSAPQITIWNGDIFELNQALLGKVDAIYDRAALVALPEEVRKMYTEHLIALTNKAPQLLICFEYDQGLCAGPPFSISVHEIEQHYQANYDLTLLGSTTVIGGLKGLCPATEHVWWLKPLE